MDYYSILDLTREPFSNSPDPDFFYRSVPHTGCLQQLELAIRLRRGLNVVIGDVGTGKTTLCRELIRRFDGEDPITTHLMLDPGVHSDSAFLSAVVECLSGKAPPGDWTENRKKENIKQILFENGVAENRITALIIDEGQKIAPSCLEILREFLNYETNTHKLLQIVIFAQQEFDRMIADHPNFADRINMRLAMKPLGFRESVELIRFRIRVSGDGTDRHLFSWPAMVATQGYPRRIIHLCHRVLLALIIQNRGRAGWRLVRSAARRTIVHRPARPWPWVALAGTLMILAALILVPEGWRQGVQRLWTDSRFVPAQRATAADTLSRTDTLSREPVREAMAGSTGDRLIIDPPPAAPANEATPTLAALPSPGPPVGSSDGEIMTTPMPARLGRYTIHRNETLGQLIHTIYGRYAPSYLKTILEANPHIMDPNTLSVGDVIHFPALPAAVRPLTVKVWWVEFAACRRLDQALTQLKRLRQNGIPARLVPYWNPGQGLVFSLVMTECFYDRHVAENAIRQMAFVSQQTAEIRSLWRDDTVFFSNPFRDGADTIVNHF